ncbi:MAG: hypothetical protein RI958_999 [Actinomycetota bacterium]|jgi:hypothetical protein
MTTRRRETRTRHHQATDLATTTFTDQACEAAAQHLQQPGPTMILEQLQKQGLRHGRRSTAELVLFALLLLGAAHEPPTIRNIARVLQHRLPSRWAPAADIGPEQGARENRRTQ